MQRAYTRMSRSLQAPGGARSALEAVVFGEALGRQAPRLGPRADPLFQIGLADGEGPPGRIAPGQAVGELEDARVRQAAVLEALQAHALAARHLGHLSERENQYLAVLSDRRDVIA